MLLFSKIRTRSILRFLQKNYLLSLFLLIIGFVAVVLVYKMLSSKPEYVYAKVKVSQGLWWASTAKPTQWYIHALKKGLTEGSGENPTSKVLNVRYYPSYTPDQFDVYMTVQLTVTYNEKNGKYFFKRSVLNVASPVEFEFPTVSVTGTVIAISEFPFEDKYTEKTVTLSKNYANPSEFAEIQIGDTYFDGEEKVMEILKKEATDSVYSIRDIGPNFIGRTENRKDIVLTVKLKGKESDGKFIFGEEQVIRPGKAFYAATNAFTFSDYTIRKVE